MSVHRNRGPSLASDGDAAEQRRRAEEIRVEVDDLVAELLVLWVLMPAAMAKDSAGLLNDDRHASGARDGSPSPANSGVIEATVLIELGTHEIATKAAPLLGITASLSTVGVLRELGVWHERLARNGQPLAHQLHRRLKAWVGAARAAVGTRHRDHVMAQLCPDHRDDAPTRLRQVGAVATIAPSLRAGPPPLERWRSVAGAPCQRPAFAHLCGHDSCARILDRRHALGPGPWWSDWVLTVGDHPRWQPLDENDHAFTWETSRTIRCPHCKTTWSTTTERRVLARRLAALGDASPDAAALIT